MWFEVTKQGMAPTYKAVHNITQSYLSGLGKKFNWKFLMIEVKCAKGMWFGQGLSKGSH